MSSFPATQGRPQVYPWDEWTNGEIWDLDYGRDFFCEPKSFRTLVHRTAQVYGLRARTKFGSDKKVIISFYDPEEL
jgi:hypothetical protein